MAQKQTNGTILIEDTSSGTGYQGSSHPSQAAGNNQPEQSPQTNLLTISFENGPTRNLTYREAKKLFKIAFQQLITTAGNDNSPLLVVANQLTEHGVNGEWDQFELLKAVLNHEPSETMAQMMIDVSRVLEYNSVDIRRITAKLLNELERLTAAEAVNAYRLREGHW